MRVDGGGTDCRYIDVEDEKLKRLLIWGTGALANHMLANGIYGEILGFVETKKSKEEYLGKRVYGVDELPEGYDFIVVANVFSYEIHEICQAKGISVERVIFLKAARKHIGYSNTSVIRDVLGERNYTEYCIEYGLADESFIRDDREKYEKLNSRKNFDIDEKCLWPIMGDKYALAGGTGNYFWQDLWAARRIIRSGVREHFDIGSRLDGFIAHLLAADVDVTMIDIREFPGGKIEHLHTIVDDATTLQQIPDESIESMSALCSLEHFGLGRYGDTVDPEGCFKCFANIQRKIRAGGRLYISVPIGRERVEFNAHRVFFVSTIVECFSSMYLEEVSCTAGGQIEYGIDIHKYDNDPHHGAYRYGLFAFIKK